MKSAASTDGRGLFGSSKEMIGKAFARLGACVNEIGDFDNGTGFATYDRGIGNGSVWFDRFVGLRSVVSKSLVDTGPRGPTETQYQRN